jgi:starvation-inducible outer membrane lipoprotein
MKKLALLLCVLLIPAALAVAGQAGKSFTGEIMDSQCAMMGSHDQMMKSMHAKDAKDCTIQCAKMGGKYVLYNAAEKTTYQFDNQTKPAQFAGQKVTVTGSLKGKTLHVEKIEAAT